MLGQPYLTPPPKDLATEKRMVESFGECKQEIKVEMKKTEGARGYYGEGL